jgi:mRNA interferase HigB
VHVISRTRLREFWEQYADAESSLRLWYTRTKRASWHNLAEMKNDYPSADLVGRFTVFNIGGNKYRLIVRIEYERLEVYIRHLLTHAEYDTDKWKQDEWF